MTCKYNTLSLQINENQIPTDMGSVLGVLEMGFPKWKMVWGSSIN